MNLYKQSGPTSFDCIRSLKRIYHDAGVPLPRMGHLGTLDPLAEGVLPVAIGSARRLIRFFDAVKEYLACIRLGISTDTDDIEGSVTSAVDASGIGEDDIRRELERFTGEIEQVPPKISAVSSQGRKAYKRARDGEEFELKPRRARVLEAEFIEWREPDMTVRFKVSHGTYIRSIARDLGAALGTGGCLASLVREADGPFAASESVSLEDIERDGVDKHMLPLDFVLSDWTRITLAGERADSFKQGRTIGDSRINDSSEDRFIAVYDESGFLGIGIARTDRTLKPYRVLRSDSQNGND